MDLKVLGTFYAYVSDDYQRGLCPIARTVKAEKHDLAVAMSVEASVAENVCVNDRGFAEREPQVSVGLVPTLRAEEHGNVPKVIERVSTITGGMRERQPPGADGISPTMTAGDTRACRIEDCYRLRKLTPRECWRLMGFSDEDFDRAASVCSNTQLYKQAGNSIVKDVLVAIFGQLMPSGENRADG